MPASPERTVRPSFALAWSEARVDAAGEGAPTLALWLPEGETVALGIGQSAARELDIEAVRRDGVRVVRRQSGGGAVLLYPGVLCWEAWAGTAEIAARSSAGAGGGSGIRQAYAVLTHPVLAALRGMGIDAFQAGICDVSVRRDGWEHPKKLAGTAQLRRRSAVLVHGSLLVNPDIGRLARYLGFPSEQPEYRRDRSHRDFCVSVAELAGGGDAPGFMRRVAEAIVSEATAAGWATTTPPEELDGAASALERDKYRSDAWNWERIRSR